VAVASHQLLLLGFFMLSKLQAVLQLVVSHDLRLIVAAAVVVVVAAAAALS